MVSFRRFSGNKGARGNCLLGGNCRLEAKGVTPTSRGECLDKLRTIDEWWAELVVALHDSCKLEWDYQVPQTAVTRRLLAAYCVDSLRLFNEFVRECPREYWAKKATADNWVQATSIES